MLDESVKHTVGVSARTCARAFGSRSRSSPTRWSPAAQAKGLAAAAAGRGAAAGQAVAAVPLPHPVPALRRGVARAGGPAGRRARVRARLQPRPAARAHPGRARRPSDRSTGTHLYDRSACSSGWSIRGTTAAAATDPTGPSRRRARRSSRCAPTCSSPQATALIDEVGLGNAALQQVLRHLLLSKEAQGKRPRLHLLRRARHQPARRGLRGPDVLHRLLRRDRPVRGGQGRRRREGLVGRAGRRGPTSIADDGLRPRADDPITGEREAGAAPARDVRVPARRPRAAAVGVVLHPRGAHPVHRRARRSRSCSTRTAHARPPRRSSTSPSASRRSARARSPSRRCASSPSSTSRRRQDELGATHRPRTSTRASCSG